MTNTDNYVYEYATLGCIIKENHLIEDPNHKEELFTGQRRLLYRAMKELHAEKKPIDMVTLITKNMKTDFGGVAAITECQNRSYVKKYESYLKIAREEYTKREKKAILNQALQEDWDLERVSVELDKLVNHEVNDRKESANTLKEMLELPWKDKPVEERTLKTGIKMADNLTGGFADGELIVVAARPSVGKTDFVNHMHIQAAQQGYKPIMFSLEMGEHLITTRLVGTVGNINRFWLKDPKNKFSDKLKEQWTTIIGETSKIGLVVYDKPRQTISEIKAKVRKERLLNPDSKILITVDYLTLIHAEGFNFGMEVKMFGYIAEELKAIAKEFNVVVVCLSQLSRKCEERNDKRPMASDIRESGAIEQVANTIIGLYRDSLYTEHELGSPNDKAMEWIFLKVREGSTGTVFVDYNRPTGVMRDFTGKPPYCK